MAKKKRNHQEISENNEQTAETAKKSKNTNLEEFDRLYYAQAFLQGNLKSNSSSSASASSLNDYDEDINQVIDYYYEDINKKDINEEDKNIRKEFLKSLQYKYAQESNSEILISKINLFNKIKSQQVINAFLNADNSSIFSIISLLESLPISDNEEKNARNAISIFATISSSNSLKTFDHYTPELIEKIISHDVLSSITGMQNSKGMISYNDFNKLEELCSDDNRQLDKELLKSITGMQHGKGMISDNDFNKLKELCSDDNGQLDKKLLKSITGMQAGKGMISDNDFNKLKELCRDDNGQLDKELLKSITGMQNGKGMISDNDFNKLIYLCRDDNGQLDKKLLKSITAMQAGKGMIPLNIYNKINSFCEDENILFRTVLNNYLFKFGNEIKSDKSKRKNFFESLVKFIDEDNISETTQPKFTEEDFQEILKSLLIEFTEEGYNNSNYNINKESNFTIDDIDLDILLYDEDISKIINQNNANNSEKPIRSPTNLNENSRLKPNGRTK